MSEDKLLPKNPPGVPPAVITVNEETPKASFVEKLKIYKRKVIIGFLLALILLGTSFAAYKLGQKQAQPGSQPTPTSSVEGKFCGGIDGIRCPPGYICQLEGRYPDVGGVCKLELKDQEKVFCDEPRPEVCTMECIVNPPYICGSDGKSYCSSCQACSNKNVEWYVTQDEPCEF